MNQVVRGLDRDLLMPQRINKKTIGLRADCDELGSRAVAAMDHDTSCGVLDLLDFR